MQTQKQRIINCHTHIFTGDHVPPWLAKTFLPFPLYYLLPLTGVVSLLRWWYNGPYKWQFEPWYKKIAAILYRIKVFLSRTFILNLIVNLLGVLITIHVFFFLYDSICKLTAPESTKTNETINSYKEWLLSHYLLFSIKNIFINMVLIFVLLLFVKWGRNLILMIFKKIWSFFGVLPGKKTTELLKRYVLIGRFSRYKNQEEIFLRLRDQYPEGTGFIVLPMDMKYMDAGKVNKKYEKQMEELADLKTRYSDIIYPFVFADPGRIKEDKNYLICRTNDSDGKAQLEECFVKTYIEKNKFSGFKIYPALGYYPFDESLLPLWKYAADWKIPIITHCIRGTIFYRGKKKKEWDKHPVFEQAIDGGEYEALLLPEMKNSEFINNFTHPLNYLCLLDETLLRKVIGNAKSKEIKDLFGYTNKQTPLKHNLRNLKICFGHFGGNDEWTRFLESDRDRYSSQVVKYPDDGILFLRNRQNKPTPGKLEQVWKTVDWYSIICSLILQYPNVYADISYILHKDEIIPLLKQTLHNSELKKKVLYGTDFYVVRNHKSDKNMLADMMAGLDEKEFDSIARDNPKFFL